MKPETEAWVEVAETDYRVARLAAQAPDPILEAVCFHAQQCVEKYLKALLEEAGRPVPRIHDLGRLYALAIDLAPDLAPHETAIETIGPFAVVLRYPGGAGLFDDLDEDAELAESTMSTVRSLVRTTLGLPADTP